MTGWLQEFRARFHEAVLDRYGKDERLGELEEALAAARAANRVGREDLVTIESGGFWSYREAWPRLSEHIEGTIDLLGPPWTRRRRKRAVRELYERLRHIEVVSVILRFVYPDEFGIISPPITSLLCLRAPLKHSGPGGRYVSNYLRYLDVLRKLQSRYGMDRVADVEMGLWSAACLGAKLPEAEEAMERDADFQLTRMRNLVGSLPERRGGKWLRVFADAMNDRDPAVAGLLLAPYFERLVIKVATSRGHDFSLETLRGVDLWRYIEELEKDSDPGFSAGELRACLWLRNRAVHPKHPDGSLKQHEVVKLLECVDRLEKLTR